MVCLETMTSRQSDSQARRSISIQRSSLEQYQDVALCVSFESTNNASSRGRLVMSSIVALPSRMKSRKRGFEETRRFDITPTYLLTFTDRIVRRSACIFACLLDVTMLRLVCKYSTCRMPDLSIVLADCGAWRAVSYSNGTSFLLSVFAKYDSSILMSSIAIECRHEK